MRTLVYCPGDGAWFGAADAVIIELPDEITDVEDIAEYLGRDDTDARPLMDFLGPLETMKEECQENGHTFEFQDPDRVCGICGLVEEG